MGAGRKKSALTIRTRAMAEQIIASGITPLEYMVNLMREPKPKRGRGESDDHYDRRVQVWKEQCFEAAKSAAPFLHPRLAAVEYSSGMDDDPSDKCIRVEFVTAQPRP